MSLGDQPSRAEAGCGSDRYVDAVPDETRGWRWVRPAPWLLAPLLVTIVVVLWCFAVSRFLRADAWGEERARPD